MDLVVWGAKGHAKVLLDALRPQNPNVIAYGDNDPNLNSTDFEVPLLKNFEALTDFLESWRSDNSELEISFVVAIGGGRGRERREIAESLGQIGLRSVSAIHPRATVSPTARIGQGVQLLANTSIGPDSVLGDSVIVNTGGIVEHDCQLGNGVHVAPGATLLGEVVLGDDAFIGGNATVLPRIVVGAGATIGAGAVVTRDVPPFSTVRGNPAR